MIERVIFLFLYFEIGRLLNEAGKEYGKNVIKQYAEKLIIEVGKKYNERTLYGMRKLLIVNVGIKILMNFIFY